MVKITLLRYGLSVVWISTLVNYIRSGESVMIPWRKRSFWFLVSACLYGLATMLSAMIFPSFLISFILIYLLIQVIGVLTLLWLASSTTTPDKEDTL